MKLPIKKKFFDQLKTGEKTFDARDAHLTFVCEETGEEFRVPAVKSIALIPKKSLEAVMDGDVSEFDDMFTDEYQMVFYW